MLEIRDFLLHLRLNYNFFILSAPFFLGALYVPEIIDVKLFIFLFILLYVFLFGGANAYNSYFDKDEGPIGGLEHPPKMKRWMYYLSIILQLIGLLLSLIVKPVFGFLFLISIILFWLYSSPVFRFKGKALLSFLVIGIGTAFNTTLMGYVSAGGSTFDFSLILGALGVTFIILSMYPFSQVYQIDEDTKRGDVTFAVKYGVRGIKINYAIFFFLGVVLLVYSLRFNILFTITFLLVGILAYVLIWQIIKTISGKREEYRKVMRTKYLGGLCFTITMLIFLIIF